jgi:hypothetical protein
MVSSSVLLRHYTSTMLLIDFRVNGDTIGCNGGIVIE